MNEEKINYFIFVTNRIPTIDRVIPSPLVIRRRLEKKYWPIGRSTRNRGYLTCDDRFVCYAAGPYQGFFIAMAVLASDCQYRSLEERERFQYEYDFLLANNYGVKLAHPTLFMNRVDARDIVSELSFVHDVSQWGKYFQSGVLRITPDDFDLIVSSGSE